MSRLNEAQAALDAAQIAFLMGGGNKNDLNDWFTACLNSACGPIAGKYGDAAVWGMLQIWANEAKAKADEDEAKA